MHIEIRGSNHHHPSTSTSTNENIVHHPEDWPMKVGNFGGICRQVFLKHFTAVCGHCAVVCLATLQAKSHRHMPPSKKGCRGRTGGRQRYQWGLTTFISYTYKSSGLQTIWCTKMDKVPPEMSSVLPKSAGQFVRSGHGLLFKSLCCQFKGVGQLCQRGIPCVVKGIDRSKSWRKLRQSLLLLRVEFLPSLP